MVIKRSPGGQACRWRAVNFEIHLWSSGLNADCIFGDRSASSMSKWRPAWTLTPDMIPFGTKSVMLSMLIDVLPSTMSCRSTQVKIASTDLWPQEMFTFSEMLALVESKSSFGAYVCQGRPGGSRAISDLVGPLVFTYTSNKAGNVVVLLNSNNWKSADFIVPSSRSRPIASLDLAPLGFQTSMNQCATVGKRGELSPSAGSCPILLKSKTRTHLRFLKCSTSLKWIITSCSSF